MRFASVMRDSIGDLAHHGHTLGGLAMDRQNGRAVRRAREHPPQVALALSDQFDSGGDEEVKAGVIDHPLEQMESFAARWRPVVKLNLQSRNP